MSERLRNPAVVLDPGAAGIGIIHALSLAGVPTVAVVRNWPPMISRLSRFLRYCETYSPRGGETVLDGLDRLARRFDGKGVLFPATDIDLEAIIIGRERLAERYSIPASPEIGLKIDGKNWQYEHADRVGMPTPRHVVFRGGEQPDVQGFRFPLIVKPSARGATAGDWVFRLQILDDADALARCLATIAKDYPGREFQVAENIPGEPDELYTVGTYSGLNGRVQRCYTGRKLTQYPYHHGVASLAESMPLPEHVVRDAENLLNSMGFVGISQVEYKRDHRDGAYKLLEVNGRSWLWVKLAAFSDVNLPLMQYYDLTGDPRLADAVARPQRHDRFFVHELHVALNNHAGERARLAELERTKMRVSAIPYGRDPLLSAAFHAGAIVRRVRYALTPGNTPAGGTWTQSQAGARARKAVKESDHRGTQRGTEGIQ
jgi:predicted ATP-grasp superfamily ATP-dependent carboligase